MVKNSSTKHRKDIGIRLNHSMPIPPNCNASTLNKLTIEVIRFLLYQRQQIPEPYQLLTRQCSLKQEQKGLSDSRSIECRRESRIQKQVYSFLTSLKNVENLLESAFSNGDCKEVHFCIGPTPISAREIYCIQFSNFISDDNPSNVSPQVEKLCCRKLCSTLFLQDEYFLDTTQLTSVNIFVNARRGSLATGWLPWPQYKANPKKIQLTLTLSPDLCKSQEVERNKENITLFTTTSTQQPVHYAKSTASFRQRTPTVDSNLVKIPGPKKHNAADVKNPSSTDYDESACSNRTKNDESKISRCLTQDVISGELMHSLSLESDSFESSDSHVWYRASIALKGFKY